MNRWRQLNQDFGESGGYQVNLQRWLRGWGKRCLLGMLGFLLMTSAGWAIDRSVESRSEVNLHSSSMLIAQENDASEGDRLFEEGVRLLEEGDTESLRQAFDIFEEARQLYGTARDQSKEAEALLNLGRISYRLRDEEQALSYLNQALPLFRAVDDQVGEANALNGFGVVYYTLGNLEQALDYYEQALTLFLAAKEQTREVDTNIGELLYNIGRVYTNLDDREQALQFYQQALQLLQVEADRVLVANILNDIGIAYYLLGVQERVLDYYNQALQLFQVEDDRAGEAATLYNIGRAYSDSGVQEQALDYFQQALSLFQLEGNRVRLANTLGDIGVAYQGLGDREEALTYYNQALQLFREEADQAGEAMILSNIGRTYSDLSDQEQALNYFQQALSLFQVEGNRIDLANTLGDIGVAYYGLGDQEQALNYYNQALQLFREEADQAGEATILYNIGRIYSDLDDQEQVLNYYQQSLQLSQESDRARVADMLNSIGGAYLVLGDPEQALTYFDQAIPVWQEIDDEAGKALAFTGIGVAYHVLNNYGRALYYFLDQALPLWQAVNDYLGQALTLRRVGEIYYIQGNQEEALNYYNQALPLLRTVSNHQEEAVTFNSIGASYSALGNQEQALNYFDQALTLSRETDDRQVEAATLNSIGIVYLALGNQEQALNYFDQALTLSRETDDRQLVTATLNNISQAYIIQGDYVQAWTHYTQALILSRQTNDRRLEVTTLNNIAGVYFRQGDYVQALDYFLNQVLPLSKSLGLRQGEARALNNIGSIYHSLGNSEQAQDYYIQAIVLSQAIGDRVQEAGTLGNLAALYQNQGNLATALQLIEEATDLIEELRTQAGNTDLKTSYFASVQDYYQIKIDLEMQLGQTQDAFETSERTRARSLIELLAESSIDFSAGVDDPELQALLNEERNLLAQRDAQYNLLGTVPEAERETVQTRIRDLDQQLDRLKATLRRKHPAYANLEYPQPLTLEQVQRSVLDEDTVLLQYALGADRSYLFVVTPTTFDAYTLAGRSEIEIAATSFQSGLKASGDISDVKRPGDALFPLILQDINGQNILNQIPPGKRLLIAADGILHYIPFAALPLPNLDDYVPLLQDYEIINTPSVTSIATQRELTQTRPPAPKRVAILADPVFSSNDDRLSTATTPSNEFRTESSPIALNPDTPPSLEEIEADLNRSALERSCVLREGQSLARLPWTRQESEWIRQLLPNAETLNAWDFDATQEWVLNAPLDQYQIVHFATHGCADSVNPTLSGLVLTQVNETGQQRSDGFLRLSHIFNLKLPAELVVLSACQTGLGENIRGEGLIGLTRGFMYAGAKRVMVSLWNVNDQTTAVLMENVYKAMLPQQQTPTQALRAAQLEMWKNASNPLHRHPRYWAAFTLQGEWQER